MPKYRPWHPRHTAIETHEHLFPIQSDLYRCKRFRTHRTCDTAPVNSQTLVKAVGLLLNPEPPYKPMLAPGRIKQACTTHKLTYNQYFQPTPHSSPSSTAHTHTHTHTHRERECNCTPKSRKQCTDLSVFLFLPPSFLSCPPWRPIHTCLLAAGAGATVVEER